MILKTIGKFCMDTFNTKPAYIAEAVSGLIGVGGVLFCLWAPIQKATAIVFTISELALTVYGVIVAGLLIGNTYDLMENYA